MYVIIGGNGREDKGKRTAAVVAWWRRARMALNNLGESELDGSELKSVTSGRKFCRVSVSNEGWFPSHSSGGSAAVDCQWRQNYPATAVIIPLTQAPRDFIP